METESAVLTFVRVSRLFTFLACRGCGDNNKMKEVPMNPMKVCLMTASAFLITACASTTIFPEGGNTFSSVSTSSEQSYAEKDALKKAETYCQKQNKKLVVLNHNTTYQGTDASQKIIGGVVSGVLGGPNPAVSSSDYEVKMRFRCE